MRTVIVEIMDGLPALGIDLKDIHEALENEGIEKFIAPYESLLSTLAAMSKA